MSIIFLFLESQKKKSNNQDDSDEDDDDDEAGPSTQQVAAVPPQAGYATPMVQPGIPQVAGAPGMPPGAYQGKHHLVNCRHWEATQHRMHQQRNAWNFTWS